MEKGIKHTQTHRHTQTLCVSVIPSTIHLFFLLLPRAEEEDLSGSINGARLISHHPPRFVVRRSARPLREEHHREGSFEAVIVLLARFRCTVE